MAKPNWGGNSLARLGQKRSCEKFATSQLIKIIKGRTELFFPRQSVNEKTRMKRIKSKIILGLATSGTALALLPLLSAFEAHVINVTATIENALSVPLDLTGINFGTVFPEEVLHKNLDIGLSNSFVAEPTVDDVEYMIRQKPKCGLPIPNTDPVEYSEFEQAVHNPDGTFSCPSPGSVVLPLLCPYLSKHEITTDGIEGENDGSGIDSFHGPLVDWHLIDSINTQVTGRLVKSGQDTSDQWDIDLHVPCFKGQCAQDNVIPPDYQADPTKEHQLFGCDLWVEVTRISTPTEHQNPATLTVNKVLIKDNGGNDAVNDFQLFVVATTSTQVFHGVAQNFAGGNTYTVTEFGVSGYHATFSGDCDAAGQVTLAPGDNKQCTITNDDIAPNITLHKTVINDASPPGVKNASFFTLKIDGSVVPQDTSVAVTANSAHSINENAVAGYHFVSLTGDAKCPAVLGGTATLNEGEAITCTITNSDDGGAQ